MQDLWGIKLDCLLSVWTLYGAELSRRCAESAINVLFRVLVLISANRISRYISHSHPAWPNIRKKQRPKLVEKNRYLYNSCNKLDVETKKKQ